MGRPKHESRKTGLKGHGQSKNRFRFQSFTERISRIKIDVGHRLGLVETFSEDAETFFYQGLQRWIDLNCTEDISAFTRQVHKVQTLNQLVHHQNLVIDSLKSHLQVRNSIALLPLLDLLVQIARDLQADFFPRFADFFKIVMPLLDTKDTELIEAIFTCVAFLVKFLALPCRRRRSRA